jgi:uncharacterized coiled-coil protein SlyX
MGYRPGDTTMSQSTDFTLARLNRFEERLTTLEINQREHGNRLTAMGMSIASMGKEISAMSYVLAGVHERIDGLDAKLDLILRRLDIREG